MTPAAAKRERARRIREAAAGHDDQISRTLIGLAEDLEIEASWDDARQAQIARQRHQSGFQ
jgi:hypothetical protein